MFKRVFRQLHCYDMCSFINVKICGDNKEKCIKKEKFTKIKKTYENP